MESLDSKNIDDGFLKHVFKFDNDSKCDMMNIIQYSIISLVPVVLLNKLMQKYIPEADEDKSSLELTSEVFLQIISIFLGIYLIHRIVTYFPPYSGVKYEDFSVTNIILIGLVIIGSLQTKLGEKISILVERVNELWNGKDEDDKKKKKKNNKSQAHSNNQTQAISPPPHPQSMSMAGTTSISQLPTENIPQNVPDLNNSFRSGYGQQTMNDGQMNPLEGNTIMAANEALGGSAFGANF